MTLSAKNNRWSAAFIVVAGCLPLSGCQAQSLPENWQSDCVGRMQISMPEAADIATVTPDSIIRSVSSGNHAESFFVDGQAAPYSAIGYFGAVDATGPLGEEGLATLRARLAHETTLVQKNMLRRKKAGENIRFSVLPTSGWDGVAWDFGERIHGRFFIGRQYYAWMISMEPEHRPYLQATFKTLMTGLATRKNFTLPNSRGVCMPNFFVGDGGSTHRSVSVTFRLPSQPDVTVIFHDASAPKVQSFQNPAQFTAQAQTNFFWTQRYQSPISRETLSNETISFAGQKGLEIRLKLGREDGSEDFGYSVFTRGDPDAKQDTPDLMLILIRNAADAKAKGRTPISEEAFFALAKTIAASVKVRPVAK
jgi:hypothetical protein